MHEDNPYLAPQVTDAVSSPNATIRVVSLRIAWIVAVLINLPIPVMFGISMTKGVGRLGMVVGTILVSIVGLQLCRTKAFLMLRLCIGSVLTALSQFYPVLQMLVGIVGVGISRFVCSPFSPGSGDLSGPVEVTLATVLTGLGLILPSIGMGFVVGLLIRLPDRVET